MEGEPTVLIRAMREGDIPEVVALEREAFASEGVITPFRRELANKLATYLVASAPEKKAPVVGYAGLWFIIDEAHLTSLAVRETERSKGIGRRLLMASLQLAVQRQATMMTLEVRASNKMAQGLYEKFGFRKVGVRKGYYSDNHEDAYLMTVEGLDQAETIQRFGLTQSPP